MIYRYGIYVQPQDNDPVLTDEDDALEGARELSRQHDGEVVAVWGGNALDDLDLCYLVVGGKVFCDDAVQ